MTLLILRGGTDVAEMALFDSDAMPRERRSGHEAKLAARERAGSLLRFRTGSDESYLLHAYVEESVPPEIVEACDVGTKIQERLVFSAGKMAFGGIESAYLNFRPNQNLRSDARVPPGKYAITAYRTDFPDAALDAALDEVLSKSDRLHLALPKYVLGAAFVGMSAAILADSFYLGAAVIGISLIGLWMLLKGEKTSTLRARQALALQRFPSIVVEMRML